MKAREQSKLEKEILEKCWYIDEVFRIGQSPERYEKFLKGIGGRTLFQQMSEEAFELFTQYDVMMWMNQSRKRRKWKRYQR